MKAIIQRVTNAKIILNDEIPVNIASGICVLVGFHKEDTLKDLEYIVRKILSVKLYPDDDDKKWKKSVVDKLLEVLIISQYTIYNGWKGNTPDFHKTMGGEKSQEFYTKLIEMAREMYDVEKVKDGVFGIYRQLYLENDGPVTFEIDSPQSCRDLPNDNDKNKKITNYVRPLSLVSCNDSSGGYVDLMWLLVSIYGH